MKTNTTILALCAFMLLQGAVMAQAPVNTWLSGNGNYWTNAANWSLGVVPDSTQQVFVPGTNANQYAGGDIIVDSAAYANSLALNAGTYAFNVTNGGTLTVYLGGNSIFTAGSGTRTFNIYAGSALVDAAPNGAGNCVRAYLNIYSGATVTGFDDFRTGAKVTIDGGTWTPATLTTAGSIVFNTEAGIELKSGTLYLGIFNNNSVRYFNILSTSVNSALDFSGGNIVLVPKVGYVPKPGHAFTLWNDGGTGTTFTPGNGRNISIQGHPDASFDLSRWASTGTIVVMNRGTLVTVR